MMSFDFEYTIIRSSRRSMSVEVKKNGKVMVRIPRLMSNGEVEKFLSERERWITEHIKKATSREEKYDFDRYTEPEIKELKRRAADMIPVLVEKYKQQIGVEPSAVRINRAKGRFGSCSAKRSLNFSCFLMLYPLAAIEYVVVHELCHIKEHNHSRRFYREIEKVMPDYRDRVKILKNAGCEDTQG